MARPPKHRDIVDCYVRLDKPVADKLDELAKALDRPRAWLIALAVKEHLAAQGMLPPTQEPPNKSLTESREEKGEGHA